MSTAGGNKDSLAGLLIDTVAHDTKLLVQLLAEVRIQVKLLRVNRVMLILSLEFALQELAKLERILSPEQVPHSGTWLAIGGVRRVQHDVHGIGHIEMKPRRALAALTLEGRHRIVHFWA